VDSYIGVSLVELRKHSNKNREIVKRDIPIVKGIVWGHKGQSGRQVARVIGVFLREVPK
jgi:hypothetical protein